MSRTILTMNLVLLILLLNGINESGASTPPDFNQFLKGMGDKIGRTAANIKEYLLELFYRFRAFFTSHSESTHHAMASRGCGYAADDEPAIYNKQTAVIAKIKGGHDAIWHTWYVKFFFRSNEHGRRFVLSLYFKAMDGLLVYQCTSWLELCRRISQ
jgi:hypothetical protein